MTKSIGLYGGSFNPPHAGHLQVAQRCREVLGLDEVWLLVAWQNPDKPIEQMALFEHRVAMCEIAAAPYDWLKVIDFEQQLKSTQTYEILPPLMAQHPNTKFTWLMGSDNLPTMHTWDNWQDLLQLMPMALVNRTGIDSFGLSSPAGKFIKPQLTTKHFNLIEDVEHEGRSTHIRESISVGQPHPHLADNVAEYIRTHNLYLPA